MVWQRPPPVKRKCRCAGPRAAPLDATSLTPGARSTDNAAHVRDLARGAFPARRHPEPGSHDTTMPTIASSARQVPPSRIREIADAAMKMDGVLKLYFGESNLPTPEHIKRAAAQALEDGYTFYSENAGLPGLREDLAAYYRRTPDGGARPPLRDRRHRLRRPGAERRHPLHPEPRRRGPRAHPRVAERRRHHPDGQRGSGGDPPPASGRPVLRGLRGAGGGRDIPDASPGVHLPLESARLGGHGARAGRSSWRSPGATTCGSSPTRCTTASTTPARRWAPPPRPSCARPPARTPWWWPSPFPRPSA